MGKSGWFLAQLSGPLLKNGLSLIGNKLKPLAKSVLIPLVLITAASATYPAIHKKTLGSAITTSVISKKRTKWYCENS